MKQALSNGFQVWYDPVTITMRMASTQAGSTVTVSPTKLTLVRHQKNLKDNGLYIKTATMDLEPGQLQPNGYSVKGPITNLLVTFESIPFNTSIPSSIRKVPVGNSGWGATRDDHGVWHFVVPESAQFLVK